MPDYSPSEIVDIILILGECHLNDHEASRVYRDRYPERERHPSPAVIRSLKQRARQGHLKRKRKYHVYDENDDHVWSRSWHQFISILIQVSGFWQGNSVFQDQQFRGL